MIDSIIIYLQDKISVFCLDSCNAKCCKIGKIILSQEQAISFNIPILLRKDKLCELSLIPVCPKLQEKSCSIYDKEYRPVICKQYPFFIRGKKIFVSSACVAIQQDFFKKDFENIKKLGYKIIIQ